MGLYKRGRVWWMSFVYKGKRYRKSTETEDRKLAQRIHDKVKGEVAEGKWFERLPGEDKTFGEMARRFIKENIPSRSRKPYLANIKTLSAFLGNCPLVEITPKVITEFKLKRRTDGVKPATINHEVLVLKRMFNVACGEWEWLDRNPVQSVPLERGVAKRDRWITQEEEEKILAHSRDWLKEVVLFALNTGMREGEIVDLGWKGGVDLFRKTITVLRAKNDEKRTIPMNARVYEMLKEKARVRQLSSGQVFHLDCKPLTVYHIQRAFRLACKGAGIKDLHFHDLRHTFATRLVQAGEDLYNVQSLLGHKGGGMTQRYAHHSPESLRRSVEILDRLGSVTNLSQVADESVGTM